MEGKIIILPYTQVNGIATMTHSDLAEIYDKFVDQGLSDTIFTDGSCQNVREFIMEMTASHTMLFVPCLDGEPMGIVWLNRLEKTTAHGHFGFFREHWGTGNPGRAAKQFMKWATSTMFQTLIGVVPSWNAFAKAGCRAVGMHELGEVPGYLYSEVNQKPITATIFYTTKEDFKNENLQ